MNDPSAFVGFFMSYKDRDKLFFYCERKGVSVSTMMQELITALLEPIPDPPKGWTPTIPGVDSRVQ